MNPSAALTELCELIVLVAQKRAMKKAVFSKPEDKKIQKAVLTLRETNKKTFLQAEFFQKDNKVTHKNFPLDDTLLSALQTFGAAFSQINLICTAGECEYKRSAAGNSVLLGAQKLKRKLSSSNDSATAVLSPISNNREKDYILNGSEPFLKLLGVADANGRVYDRRQAKFRQINRFLELIRDVEDKLPSDEIRICDLCCGKSYLSFAVYHYFANVKHARVFMTGVDLKQDVIDHCNAVAKQLAFDGLEFLCQDIRGYAPAQAPSLVISLHACDIATDLVLTQAVEWGADVILSTPCCHHELNHNIDCPSLSFITDYSMLRQKLCDAATDALRLCRLEAQGYSTMALELIDPNETPKNIMLRAVRKKHFDPDSPSAKAAMRRYLDAKAFLCPNASDKNLHF